LARAKAGADPFVYFVQAGAYRSEPEAQAQKAKLALKGLVSAVSERDQDGRTVYRVRLGPFDSKDDAEGTKKKLDSAKIESALVRVQR
jgi:cell division protein FtsN